MPQQRYRSKALFIACCILLVLGLATSFSFAGGATLPPSDPLVYIADDALGLAWDDNDPSNLAGYEVAYSVNDEDYSETNMIDVGMSTTFDFNNLPTYMWVEDNWVDFVVHAYNEHDQRSGPSNEVGISFLAHTGPAPPSGLLKTY